MPTVLRDSSELIQLLENTVLPRSNCFLVTADVVYLYPNVDTKKALVALNLLLREAQVPETLLLVLEDYSAFAHSFHSCTIALKSLRSLKYITTCILRKLKKIPR